MVHLLSSKPKENEVSAEWFFKLKEFDSLTKMKNSLTLRLREQEDRVSKLSERRQEAHLQTVKLQHEHNALQQEMFETEKKLKTAAEQKQRLQDLGGDETKIAAFGKEIHQLEESGFSLLEKLETNEQESKDAKTFINGLEKTMAEIKAEA